MSSTKRHQFAGSTIAVFTRWDDPVAITGISQANPAVVSWPGHNLAKGDVVKITGSVGMLEADGVWIVGEPLTAGTFALEGVDSTGWGVFAAGAQGRAAVFSQWCEVTSFNRQGGSKPETAVTSVCSTAEEVELGLPSYGSVQIATNWSPDTALQQAIEANYDTSDPYPIRYRPRNARTLTTVLGFVQQTGESGATGGIWAGSVNYRITGKPVRTILAAA